MANSYIKTRKDRKGRTRYLATFVSKDPSTGRRTTESKTFDKRGDADRWRRDLISRVEKTGVARLSTRKLNSFSKDWLAMIDAKKKPTTATSYREMMNFYILDAIGETPLSKITPSLVQKKIVDPMEKRGLSETTVRYAVTVLRICLGEAVKKRLLIENAASAKRLNFAEGEVHERRSMDPEEAQRFVEALASDPFRVLYLFLLMTGARPSEAFGLRWRNVDLDARVIQIEGALRWTGKDPETGKRGWTVGDTKTKKSKRSITIGVPLAAELRKHRLAAADKDPDALVFVSRDGTPLDRNNIRQRFNRIAKRAEIDGVTLYSLRHTFATLQLDQGVPVKVVSERLGHKSVTFTIDTNVHVLDEQNEAAAETLDAVVAF